MPNAPLRPVASEEVEEVEVYALTDDELFELFSLDELGDLVSLDDEWDAGCLTDEEYDWVIERIEARQRRHGQAADAADVRGGSVIDLFGDQGDVPEYVAWGHPQHHPGQA